MILVIFLLIQFTQGCLECYHQQTCQYLPKPINLHISVHPHLGAYSIFNFPTYYDPDASVKTYFESKQFKGVKQILNTAFSVLKKSAQLREVSPGLEAAHRTFMSSEMGYFIKWYNEQPKKDEVRKLIHSGYWQILGGGLVEQDQACAYIDDIIENYQLGLNFLKTELNYLPKVAISAHSFGHSQSVAALLSHLGIEGLLLQRSDQHILTINKTEFMWKTLSANGQFYGAIPTHIRWAVHAFQDQFIEDDARPGCQNNADYFSKMQQQNSFLRKVLNTSSHIIRYFGNDFQQFSDYSYQVIEAMMAQYSKDKCQSSVALYSTPTDYFKEITPNLKKQRHGDIFPVWDYDSGVYWAGHFTTDPLHKLKFRNAGRLLQALRSIHMPSFAEQPKSLENIRIHALLSKLAEEVAYLQHNGITGTSKYNIIDELQITSINAMKKAKNMVLDQAFDIEFPLHTNNPIFNCHLDSPCIIPEALSGFIYVKIINSGSIKRNHTLAISLPFAKYYIPVEPVQYQINCFCVQINCPCKLYIYSDLHRYAAYTLKPTEAPPETHYLKQFQNSKEYTANSTHLNIIFKGNIYSVSYKQVENMIPSERKYDRLDRYGNIQQKVSIIQSGKYALGNNPKTAKDISTMKTITMMNTTRKIFIRIAWKKHKMSTLVEIDKKIPKEFKITTISACTSKSDYYLEVATPIKSSVFYTDSNGWLVMKRTPFSREDFTALFSQDGLDSINGNTYPITTFAYIETQQDGADNIYNKVSVNVDRPQGVTLQKQGALWLHFDRVAGDDRKIVQEAYRGEFQSFTHTVTVQNTNNNERVIQKLYDQTTFTEGNLMPPTIKIANLNQGQSTHNKAEQVRQSEYLKININTQSDSSVLIRLLNLDDSSSLVVNLFATDESPLLSRLYGKRIGMNAIKEVSLGANTDYPEFLLNKWNSKRTLSKENSIFQKVFSENITLRPLQIRSFVLSGVRVSQSMAPYRYSNIKVNYKLDLMKAPPKRVARKEQALLMDYILNGQKCNSPSPVLGAREMPSGTTVVLKKVKPTPNLNLNPSPSALPLKQQDISQDSARKSLSLSQKLQNLQVLTKSQKLKYFTSRLKQLPEYSY